MSPLDRLALGIIAAVAKARPLLDHGDREPTPAELCEVVDAFLTAAQSTEESA